MEQRLEIFDSNVRIGVQFYRLENRFGHQIDFAFSDHAGTIQTFDEINSDWPPAPPIQDVHFEDRGDTQLLFGVGMSGKTHFSVSIAASDGNQLVFEFAAHVKESPQFLGTTYTSPSSDSSFHELASGLLTPLQTTRIQQSFDDQVGAKFKIVPEAFCEIENSSGDASEELANPLPENSLPATLQWGFAIQLGN